MTTVFFGYATVPDSARRAVAEAAAMLNDQLSYVEAITWEELRVDGRLIVNEIEAAIDRADVACFDVTDLNHNVLFELGLAIGKGKRVLITVENSSDVHKRLNAFSLLTTTGYISYGSASELFTRLSGAVAEAGSPLLDDLLLGSQSPLESGRLLYVPSFLDDEANRAVARTVDRYAKFSTRRLDLDEYGVSPFAFYVEEIYKSEFCLFHLTPRSAYLSELMNPKVALFAGLARGLNREIRIALREDGKSALDFRDLAFRYEVPQRLSSAVSEWLESLNVSKSSVNPKKSLDVELSSLRFGNHVAESDAVGLETYFVPTADYQDVILSKATIFTGRKGAGKTANMQEAARAISDDARNLVCVIKPAGYELEGLVAVLRRIPERHLSDFLIESVWKYLIYTEVASAAILHDEARPAGIPTGSPMAELRELMERDHLGAGVPFSARIENLIDSIEREVGSGLHGDEIAEPRKKIGKAVHSGALTPLREHLASALHNRQRVAVLVDNLDKAWEKGSDLESLSRILLGLLSGVGRVVDEFAREAKGRQALNVTLTVFLRSDIFAVVREFAREPDKISVAELEWRDPNLLARVLEERFVAGRPKSDPADLWTEFFAGEVRGEAPREYLIRRCQPRPRDLVFFANAAVSCAANAKHGTVTSSDILLAEQTYSQFAYQALLVEGVASHLDLEEILLEFAGERPVIAESRVRDLISESGQKDVDSVLRLLRQLGFVGIEVSESVFDYGGTASELVRADVRSKKLVKATRREARFEIHPAYRTHLEIEEE